MVDNPKHTVQLVPPCPPLPAAAGKRRAVSEKLQPAKDQPVEIPGKEQQEKNEAPKDDLSNIVSDDIKSGRAIRDALGHLRFGVSPEGEVFAAPVDRENPTAYPLDGKYIDRWLRKRGLKRGDVLKRDDLRETRETLAALALTEESILQIHLRVGPSSNGGIEIDLGTDDGRRVHLHSGKAEVISEGSKTIFSRSELTQPMPIPAEEGDWREILQYLNMPEELQLLVVAYITYCLTHYKGQSAYPLLVIRGVQGTGKSLLCKNVIRPLIDNSTVGVQMFPADIQHFVISCQNQYLPMFDNVRFISKKWSDTLCIASTAGTVSKRKLYTDADEVVMHIHRPIVLNGIYNCILEPDLASRVLTVVLDPITPENRRDESALSAEIAERMPSIYRGILNLCAQILEAEPSVKSANLTRLSDFNRWLAALEKVLNLPARRLQQAFLDNQNEAALDTIHDHPLASAVIEFIEGQDNGEWKGKPVLLLEKLRALTLRDEGYWDKGFPTGPIALSKQLKNIEKLLESQRVVVAFGRSKDRWISITKQDEF